MFCEKGLIDDVHAQPALASAIDGLVGNNNLL